MSKKGFWWRALAALILVGLVVGGGFAVHYLAWSRGYAAGQAVEGSEAVVTPPYLPHGFGYYGRPASFMFGAGMLFKCLLGLIFFVVVFKLIRFIVWGAVFHPMMHGPWPRHFHRANWRRFERWHRMRGPAPPWCWDWDEDEEAKADSDEAEA